MAQEFDVQAMLTFLLLKEGKEVERVVEAKKDELEKRFKYTGQFRMLKIIIFFSPYLE